jgi:hypothetical protein
MISATTAQDIAPTTGVPIEILELLLRDYLADPTAIVIDSASVPFSHQGTNDSTTFFRVTFTWARLRPPVGSHTATWIIKHWKAGGVRDSLLGITQSHEVLAWEQGWLRPGALPAGLVVPFIAARRSPDNSEAWLAMADVSMELLAYPRMGLDGDEVIGRAQAILAQLAHFHAMWEQPERQAELHAHTWLRRPEIYLWDQAPTYAHALGRSTVAQVPPGASAPPAWDGLADDLSTFLDSRSANDRRLWANLLIDRRALVEGLALYPQTLLHNDLDDRNIGLRWPSGAVGAALDMPNLVLIDWEWIAVGPAALDAANIVLRLPVLIAPGSPIPETVWGGELADYYFEHYRAAGGRYTDAASWRRSYGLALVAQALSQMPFIHGRMRRAISGELPPPAVVGVSEQVIRQQLRDGLPTMEQMEECVTREMRQWLKLAGDIS